VFEELRVMRGMSDEVANMKDLAPPDLVNYIRSDNGSDPPAG
jgi:hypothetical protein